MSATLGEIALRIGATIPSWDGVMNVADIKATEVETLLTDSRQLTRPASTLFFALHTHTGDGHFYLRSLYTRGVRCFVVESLPENIENFTGAVFLRVSDTMQALQQAGRPEAGYHGITIAVSGSRGKTITKEWLFDALSHTARADATTAAATRSPRSFNSQTGVPLSLWSVPADADYAVIETGISQRGEMRRLAEMVRPRVCVFTGLDDTTHAEGFSSLREKAEEKAAISTDAEAAVYNADNKELAGAVAKACRGNLYSWSRENADAYIYIKKETRLPEGTELQLTIKGNPTSITVPFATESEVEDALAVITTLTALGYETAKLKAAMRSLKPVRTRLDVVEGVNGCTVAVDGYVSDMASLPGALDFMRRHSGRGQRLTIVMSDLQGGTEADYHTLAEMLRLNGVERLIGAGTEMKRHATLFGAGSQLFGTVAEMTASLSVADFSTEFVMIKHTPGDGLEALAEMLAAHKHETVLEVNLGALARNYATYKRRLAEGTRITAMVKASAYGMGSYEVARTLQDAGADYLAVAVLDEGLELRRKGITMPIMVMNPKAVNYSSMFANRLEPEIYSPAMLNEVIEAANSNGITDYPVHIKLDTGMHRTGFQPEETEALCRTLSGQNRVRAASVFSHLATADCLDMDHYTLAQIRKFRQLTDFMASHLDQPFLRHILNSAGMVRFPEYAFDMARLGIGLYGVNTLPPPIENTLEPVARLRTVIIALHEYEAGEAIGYSRAGLLTRRTRIATLPIGYADGFNRHFGRGAAKVRIRGKEAHTIGNVCMDQCMIDVSDIECAVGDEVEIFATQRDIERLAKLLDTIPYEVLTSISPRVKRLYFRE